MTYTVSVIEKDGSCLPGKFETKEDPNLGFLLMFEDYHKSSSVFILDQKTYLKGLLDVEDNVLVKYVNSRLDCIEKALEEWGDVLDNPPPEYDGLEGYYKLHGNIEELQELLKVLNSLNI